MERTVLVHFGERMRPISFVPGNTNDVQNQAGLQGPFRVVIGTNRHAPGVGQSHLELAPYPGLQRGGRPGTHSMRMRVIRYYVTLIGGLGLTYDVIYGRAALQLVVASYLGLLPALKACIRG